MATNLKATGKASSMPEGLGLGLAVSAAITAGASLGLGCMLQAELIQWKDIGYGIMLLLLLASFLGAVTACVRIKRQRLVICLLSGFLYFGTLLSVTALFFGGQFEAVTVTAALIFSGSGAAGLLCNHNLRGRGKRKVRRGYR